jgi:hypothetical protein
LAEGARAQGKAEGARAQEERKACESTREAKATSDLAVWGRVNVAAACGWLALDELVIFCGGCVAMGETSKADGPAVFWVDGAKILRGFAEELARSFAGVGWAWGKLRREDCGSLGDRWWVCEVPFRKNRWWAGRSGIGNRLGNSVQLWAKRL